MGYDEQDNLRFYLYEQNVTHGPTPDGQWQRPYELTGLHATMRKDGFAYLHSRGVGRVGLKGMMPVEGDLNINFRAPRGRVRVQLCDLNFRPFEGFTFDDCIPLQGDELHAAVRWKSQTPQDFVDRREPCRLEFELFEAYLYAVRWTCDHLVYADAPVYDLR